MRTQKAVAKKHESGAKLRPKTEFRFKDEKHRAMIQKAANECGLSVNAWIIQATFKELRREGNISPAS